jgi:hypothetical protein
MIDLKKFCFPEMGLYWRLQTPWLHGGFAHATNKQIYVRVRCNEYGKYPDGTLKHAHTAQKLFSDFVGTGEKIKACDLAREQQTCRDCRGVGTTTEDGVDHHTCDWCMGTGVHFKPMLVRERWGIGSVYVEMCKWLPDCLIEADVEEGKPYKIYFDGGEGFVAAIDSTAPGHKGAIT